MNHHAKSPEMFDVEQHPTATYQSSSFDFEGDSRLASMAV
jgi:polyisoprenoid-binding protein YceI